MRKLRLLYLILFICLVVQGVEAQQPAQDGNQIPNKTQKLQSLNRSITDIEKKINELNAEKARLAKERLELLKSIARGEEAISFQNSPPRVVVRVSSSERIIVLSGNVEKEIRLAGIHTTYDGYQGAFEFLQAKLADGLVYVRCVDTGCSEAYLYLKKDEPSINAQLVSTGYAYKAANANLYLMGPADSLSEDQGPTQSTTSSPSTTYSGSSPSSSSAGKDVHVRGYYRKDGTYVKPHTRSAPGEPPSIGV